VAAEAIAAEVHPSAGTRDVLASLVDKSLVVVQDRVQATRYRLLEPLRHYAVERLAESGTRRQIQQRHRDWYAALATEAITALVGPEQGAWHDRLALEHDNLRSAPSWSLMQGDAAGAGAIICGIWPFWLQRGHLREGRRWLDQTLAVLVEPTPLRAQLLWIAGITARPDIERARCCLSESAVLSQQLGAQALAMRALASLAFFTQALGDHDQALAYFEQCLPIVRARDDTLTLARVLNGLALSVLAAGDSALALALCDEGLALHQQLGDQRGLGASMANLGLIWHGRGDDRRAAELWEASFAVRERIGDRGGVAHVLTLLGGLAVRQGAYGRASDLYTDSLAPRQAIGELDGVPPIFEGLAAVAAACGDLEVGAQLAGAAELLRATTGVQPSPQERAAHTQLLAMLSERLGEPAFAQAWTAGQQLSLEQATSIAARVREAAAALQTTVASDAIVTGAAPFAPQPPYALTPRERDVLRLLSRGLTYAQIGEQLVISPRTVDAHIRTIFSKLGVRSRTAATRVALEQQLV
jgi:non-specific serine/threonine protein kinase